MSAGTLPPDGRVIIDDWMVELDVINAGLAATYVFYCSRTMDDRVRPQSVGLRV